MTAITFSQLWAQKRRLLGTGLAVALGVAFLAGTLVLTDTLRAGFGTLFANVNEGIAVVVRAEDRIPAEMGGQAATIDAGLVDAVRGVDGVSQAEGEIEGFAQIVGANGRPIGGEGPPTLALSVIENPDLGGYDVVAGRYPAAEGEVAIDAAAAEAGDLSVGDRTTVLTPAPVPVEIVGLVELKGGGSLGGTTITFFTYADAKQHLVGGADRVSRILVAAEDGLSDEALLACVAPVLPPGSEAITGAALTEELVEDIGRDFLDVFELMLLVFAGIALFVASFSIHNTFTITLAQRSRQAALLRVVGATRRQVLGAVLLEAAVIGAVASALGIAGGVALAFGLKALFGLIGLAVTTGAPVLEGSTVALAFGVGVPVTVAAAFLPAVRASRVAPLAALRDAAVDASETSRRRAVVGGALAVVGVVLLVVGATADRGSTLALVGIGGLLTLIGAVVAGPAVARPVGGLLGAPLERLRGTTGSLARGNARRNPRRTAATAAALMVGVAVVTLFTVLAASTKATIDEEIRTTFGGDLVVMSGGFSGSGLSPDLAAELNRLDEVDTAVGIGFGAVWIEGEETVLTVAEPAAVARLLGLEVTAGSVEALAADEIAVSAEGAAGVGWDLGSTVLLEFVDGSAEAVRVGAIYEAAAGDSVGTYLVPPTLWTAHASQYAHRSVLVGLADGISLEAGRTAVEALAADFGTPDVQDRGEYADTVAGQVNQLLGVVYVLLALAILIALMGIANALGLSVHERTQEIGLLRAVGLTRGQVRAMVRWESVLVAVFGTLGGLGLGAILSWATIRAVATEAGIARLAFTAPVGQLATIVGVGALAGIVAATRPARRAARLDVLAAIATE